MENKVKARVVVVGGANIDMQGTAFASFVPRDSNPGRIVRAWGGVGRNIAENCARLGLSTSLITAFGDDSDGALLRSDCDDKGINTNGSLVARSPSARYLCALDADGSLVAAVADMAAMDELTPEFLETRREDLDSADYIVVDANLPQASLAWIAFRYGRTNRPAGNGRSPFLFLDTVSSAKARRAVGLSGEFDCIKPNRAEAAILAGAEETAPEILRAVMAEKGALPGELYISLAEEGIYYYTDRAGSGLIALPPQALRPKPVNRSGAGDASGAALLWADSRGCGPRDKARYALTAAMLTAASPEPVAPEMSETILETRMRLMFPEE